MRLSRKSFTGLVWLGFIMVLGASAALILMALLYGVNHEQQDLHVRLDALAHEMAAKIDQTIHQSVGSLTPVASLVALQPHLTSDQFGRFTSSAYSQTSGLLMLEWQPVVTEARRNDFVRAVRRQGGRFARFNLWEPGSDGQPMAARPRSVHIPVLYAYSANPSVATIGLDLAFSPERMASKWQARDEGQPQASRFFRVITREGSHHDPIGFAVTVPVYQGGSVPVGLSARRQTLLGFIAVVYELRTLIAAQLEQLSSQGLSASIVDDAVDTGQLNQTDGAVTVYQGNADTHVFGQHWTMQLTASQGYVDGQQDHIARARLWGMAIEGTLALAILLFVHLKQTRVSVPTAGPGLQAAEEETGLLISKAAPVAIMRDDSPLESLPFDLNDVLVKVLSFFSSDAAMKDISLRLDVPDALHLALVGDVHRLEQILFNLVSNAVKFTGQGGVLVRVLELGGAHGLRRLRFEVSDTGIGIAPEVAAHLFSPLSQIEPGSAGLFRGRGLGLLISKHLTALLGGDIGVRSAPGKGSLFWVELSFDEQE